MGLLFGTPERTLVVDRALWFGDLLSAFEAGGQEDAPCYCDLLCLETLSLQKHTRMGKI